MRYFPTDAWLNCQCPTLLTFDDGPDLDVTPRILDVLAKHRISAIFFIQGDRITSKRHTDLLKRTKAEGHMIGNHTFSHRDLCTIRADDISQEILAGETAVGCHLSPTRLLRPPYGSVNNQVGYIAHSLEYELMFWNVDPRDWDPEKQDGSWAESAMQQLQLSTEAVIVLHDRYVSTAAHLERFISMAGIAHRSPAFFGGTAPVSADWIIGWNRRPGLPHVWRRDSQSCDYHVKLS